MRLRSIGTLGGHPDTELLALIDPEWPDEEREELADYLASGISLGYAISTSPKCLLCEFSLPHNLILSDGVYEWSQIIAHYVREHKVRLPPAIVADMLTRLHDLQEAEQDMTWWRVLCGLEPVNPATRQPHENTGPNDCPPSNGS